MKSPLLSLLVVMGAFTARAASPTSPATISADRFKDNAPPFSFKYNGRDSRDFLGTWQGTSNSAPAPGGQIRRYTYTDPQTQLKVACAVRTFDNYDAVDWVLTFTNGGTADTPILEDIEPLHWTVGCDSPGATLHSAQGSNAAPTDFARRDADLPAGQSLLMGTGSGRSSDDSGAPGNNAGSWPFFNLQMGGHGLLGAIGWTGNWLAHFTRDASGKSIALDAGMTKTHLLLHPGETIRTPRILLMNWTGDPAEAQNTWRQLVITRYSPQDAGGKPAAMPISWDTWGTEFAAHKLQVIHALGEQKIPADLYWIDAGWYEPISLPPGGTASTGSPWNEHRGDWITSRNLYPDDMKPLGDALQAEGIGFLLWFEAETANADSKNLAAHPDWYLLQPGKQMGGGAEAFLNLGNPDARKWITDLVSDFITRNRLTWYRQDFNFAPAPYWAAADTPDRIGISEIKSIMGLYRFWDDLLARHPGLRIDNCASGGRRLDIETASRSVSLWRSDNAGEAIGEQFHTAALLPWLPLNAGVWVTLQSQAMPHGGATELYQQRTGYSAGLTVCIDHDPAPWIRQAFAEFDEVRPYYLGDFYALVPPDADPASWAAWQLQKTDRKSGLIVVLRRQDSPYSTIQLAPQAIDPNAQYAVELRITLEKAKPVTMKGSDLAHLSVTINDKPGSTLVFYHLADGAAP